LARLLSVKSFEEAPAPPESFELALALKLVEKETQTEATEAKDQPDTPKLFSLRAKEILAARIQPAHSSPNNENFNRFDFRYKSEIVRGSFSTPRKSLSTSSVPRHVQKSETPISSTIDKDDFVKVG
jgi:hypothetical protein